MRMIGATRGVTYFGPDSVAEAVIDVAAGEASTGEAHLEQGYRRSFLSAASGDALKEIATEEGVTPLTSTRSSCYVVFVPETSRVTAITGAGPYVLTVTGYAGWQVGDSIRVKGTTQTETATVTAIGSGTLTVAGLTYAATYVSNIAAGNTVRALFRVTLAADTTVAFQGGLEFQTLAAVTTGDANPVLGGEGTALALVDKAWAECTTRGIRGNVARLAATGLKVAVRGVKRVFNPLPATGGTDAESDQRIKYRVAHIPQGLARTQAQSVETLALFGFPDVLRVSVQGSIGINSIGLYALSASLAPLSATAKTDVASYILAHSPPAPSFTVTDMPIVSLEVQAVVTFAASSSSETSAARKARFDSMWARVASTLAGYVDPGTWTYGVTVDAGQLLKIVAKDPDVVSVDPSAFSPAADVTVSSAGVPKLARLTLIDASTGYTVGDDLSQVYT